MQGAHFLTIDESTVVRRGVWRYGGVVDAEVWICRSWTVWGTGDYEDEPDEDREQACFYTEWGNPTEPGRSSSRRGAFDTFGLAQADADALVGPIAWQSPRPLFCPKCGDLLRAAGKEWICAAGTMLLTAGLAERLRISFIDAVRLPSNEPRLHFGGAWFCPGCGAPMRTESEAVVCEHCGRYLNAFIRELVELCPHLSVIRPRAH
jgi:hypothetical protein